MIHNYVLSQFAFYYVIGQNVGNFCCKFSLFFCPANNNLVDILNLI